MSEDELQHNLTDPDLTSLSSSSSQPPGRRIVPLIGENTREIRLGNARSVRWLRMQQTVPTRRLSPPSAQFSSSLAFANLVN